MVRKALVALALAWALPAQAQSNCQWFGTIWRCDKQPSTQPPASNAMWGDYLKGIEAQNRQQIEDQSKRQQQFDAQARATASASLRQQVAGEIKAGRCQSAIEIALDAGDLDLAGQAKALCQK